MGGGPCFATPVKFHARADFFLGNARRTATLSTMPTLLRKSIARAVRRTRPGTTQRLRALARVRRVLATEDGCFVAVNDRALAPLTRVPAEAAIYDGRNNETLRARFFAALLKVPLPDA